MGSEAVGSSFHDRGQQATEIGLEPNLRTRKLAWPCHRQLYSPFSLLPFFSCILLHQHQRFTIASSQPHCFQPCRPASLQLRYTVPKPPAQLPRGFPGGQGPFIILSPHSNNNNNKLRAEAGLSLGDAINPPILNIDVQYQFAAGLDSRIDKITIFSVQQSLFHCTILYARQLAPTLSSNQSGILHSA